MDFWGDWGRSGIENKEERDFKILFASRCIGADLDRSISDPKRYGACQDNIMAETGSRNSVSTICMWILVEPVGSERYQVRAFKCRVFHNKTENKYQPKLVLFTSELVMKAKQDPVWRADGNRYGREIWTNFYCTCVENQIHLN